MVRNVRLSHLLSCLYDTVLLDDLKDEMIFIMQVQKSPSMCLFTLLSFAFPNCVAAGLGSGVKPSTILEFFNSGRDVILALGATASSQMRDLSSSLGIDVAPGKAVVIDHFHHDANIAADHTAIVTSSLGKLPAVFGSNSYHSVLFKGVGLSVSRQTEVAFHAITAERTGYAGIPGEPVPEGGVLAGQALGLVSLVQGRNNARAAVIGSVEMFSNKFLAANQDNAGATLDIVLWTFQQRGVLQASPLRHRIIGSESDNEPAIYRINDMVEVAVDIMECGESGCSPFVANDIQIEFVMLDPYIRTFLSQNPQNKNGTYSTIVKVPDTYGVFKWVLTYHRLGYSWLDIVHTVPVRPFRHYEYERFIVQAYPYYASTASMMAGFFALGFLFLYSR